MVAVAAGSVWMVTGIEPGRAGLLTEFAGLSTPLVADACIRRNVPLRIAPPGNGAVIPGRRIAGRARPARHYGSVDVFLEALGSAGHGDVLVVDNGGRADEACVGDLVVLEAQAATTASCSSRPVRPEKSWPQPARSPRPNGTRRARSRQVRPCASRRPSGST